MKNYKGKIYTYNEKSFFVNTNGNISRAMGWQGSYFIDNDGCVKYYDDGTTSFRITKNDGTKALKDGWNDDVYVKNGKIQRSTIVKSSGCNYFVDKNGSRQDFKVKNNQVVRPDNSMAVSSSIYAAAGKKYPVDSKGKIQKNSTVFIKNKAYETAKVLLYTIHHPTADEPKYENTTVITEKAWSEYYQDYTCRVCGEKNERFC